MIERISGDNVGTKESQCALRSKAWIVTLLPRGKDGKLEYKATNKPDVVVEQKLYPTRQDTTESPTKALR